LPLLAPLVFSSLCSADCCAAFALLGWYLAPVQGWAYQDIPAFAGAVISSAVVLHFLLSLRRYARKGIEKQSAIHNSCLCLLVFIAGFSLVNAREEYEKIKGEPNFDLSTIGYSGDSPYSDIDSPFATIILAHAKPHDRVIFIGNAVAPGFPPTTQLRVKPGSRHLHCCILSVLQYIKDVRDVTPENSRLLSFKDRIVKEYAEDIEKNKPVLIFVQNGPAAEYLAPYNFNQYLKQYKKIDDVAGYTAYELQVKS
jgi:hypothetical protein